MKRWFLGLVMICYLVGCASAVSTTLSESRRGINLANLKQADMAIMPLRSVLGGPVKNNTVEEYFCDYLARNFPRINLIQPGKVAQLLTSSGHAAASRYRQLLDKYLSRGRFDKDDLALFASSNINYLVVISLNGGSESHDYPTDYLFLLSVQIWEVNTGQMVWDITQEGRTLIGSEEEDKSERTELMRSMCETVLAKLS